MRKNLIALAVVGVSVVGLAAYQQINKTTTPIDLATTNPTAAGDMRVADNNVTNMNPSAGGEGGPVPEPNSAMSGNPQSGVNPPAAAPAQGRTGAMPMGGQATQVPAGGQAVQQPPTMANPMPPAADQTQPTDMGTAPAGMPNQRMPGQPQGNAPVTNNNNGGGDAGN